MLLYATTIFLSAFLLFQVQPLIAKIILPWFGGSAAVWTAAMLFFQVSLLAGYAYAHFLIGRFNAKRQMQVHGALLALSVALLPILPNPAWKPTQAGDPTLRILLVLAASIGLPYFLLSSTSPLLQAWYVRRSGGVKCPTASLPFRISAPCWACISFPFLVEPTSPRATRLRAGAGSTSPSRCCAGSPPGSREPAKPLAGNRRRRNAYRSRVSATPRPPAEEMLLWVGLAACASALLVAITNHLEPERRARSRCSG